MNIKTNAFLPEKQKKGGKLIERNLNFTRIVNFYNHYKLINALFSFKVQYMEQVFSYVWFANKFVGLHMLFVDNDFLTHLGKFQSLIH